MNAVRGSERVRGDRGVQVLSGASAPPKSAALAYSLRTMSEPTSYVYVVDAWDDDAQESYVRVFSSKENAARDLARWRAKRAGHDLYFGVLKRKVL